MVEIVPSSLARELEIATPPRFSGRTADRQTCRPMERMRMAISCVTRVWIPRRRTAGAAKLSYPYTAPGGRGNETPR
jgi:hypothetical protein